MKNKGRRVFALLLALTLPLSLFSCHEPDGDMSSSDQASESESTTQTPEPEYASRVYELREHKGDVKHLGRTSVTATGIACDAVASGIAFSAYIENEVTIAIHTTAETYFAVELDGVRLPTRYCVTGEGEITLDGLGALALHTVKLVKETEPQFGVSLAEIRSLSFYGKLTREPSDASLYIEFIGDSITSGYGNLWTSADPRDQVETARYEDGTKTYAYLAAEELGADCSILSCSGIGVVKGFRDFTMKDYYTAVSYYRDPEEKVYFPYARKPDIIVINLGTNDRVTGADPEAYKEGVRELVYLIRDSYRREIPIVWVSGMMSSGFTAHTKEVLAELGGEAAGIYHMDADRVSGAGGGGHPTVAEQEAAGRALSAFLREKKLVTE